jgi:hypothetical protein
MSYVAEFVSKRWLRALPVTCKSQQASADTFIETTIRNFGTHTQNSVIKTLE